MIRSRGDSILILGLAASFTGCTGFEPAMVGATAAGGEVATAVWSQGKLDAAQLHDGDTVRDAALAALESLGLHVRWIRQTDDREWTILVEDDQERDYRVRIDERTPQITQLRIDVGWFGSRPTAELILNEIVQRLAPEAQ